MSPASPWPSRWAAPSGKTRPARGLSWQPRVGHLGQHPQRVLRKHAWPSSTRPRPTSTRPWPESRSWADPATGRCPMSRPRRSSLRCCPRFEGRSASTSGRSFTSTGATHFGAGQLARPAKSWRSRGSACPDHLVHTKHYPLWIDFDPERTTPGRLAQLLVEGVERYEKEYKEYVAECSPSGRSHAGSLPRVILIPGIGMVSTGKDKAAAEASAGLYHRAAAVIRGAYAARHLFDARWQGCVRRGVLAARALQADPGPARKGALSPGGLHHRRGQRDRQGHGALRLATKEPTWSIADINVEGAEAVAEEIEPQPTAQGTGAGRRTSTSPTRRPSSDALPSGGAWSYGGIDILVSNAGLAPATPLRRPGRRLGAASTTSW